MTTRGRVRPAFSRRSPASETGIAPASSFPFSTWFRRLSTAPNQPASIQLSGGCRDGKSERAADMATVAGHLRAGSTPAPSTNISGRPTGTRWEAVPAGECPAAPERRPLSLKGER